MYGATDPQQATIRDAGGVRCFYSMAACRARRSAFLFSGPSESLRINQIPGEAFDQYHRNFPRVTGSVVVARVSVRKTDFPGPTGLGNDLEAGQNIVQMHACAKEIEVYIMGRSSANGDQLKHPASAS